MRIKYFVITRIVNRDLNRKNERDRLEKTEKGMACLLVIVFVSAITLLGISFMSTVSIDLDMSHNYEDYLKSLYVAEGGIQRSLWLIGNDMTWSLGSVQEYTEMLGEEGYFTVKLEGDIKNGNIITMVATGVVHEVRRSIEVNVAIGDDYQAYIVKGSWREIYPGKGRV